MIWVMSQHFDLLKLNAIGICNNSKYIFGVNYSFIQKVLQVSLKDLWILWKFWTLLFLQQTLRPSVPNDVALSFYVHASKLILSVYHLGVNASTHQPDIISRNQVNGLSDNSVEVKEYKYELHFGHL